MTKNKKWKTAIMVLIGLFVIAIGFFVLMFKSKILEPTAWVGLWTVWFATLGGVLTQFGLSNTADKKVMMQHLSKEKPEDES